MNQLKVHIDAVDGDTFYTAGTLAGNKNILLQFLEKYDHEGSSISLEIWRDGEVFDERFNEKVYEYLREE